MGTLYLVGLLAAGPDDVTLRALRVLREAPAVAASNPAAARSFLAAHGLSAPVVAATPDAVRAALAEGDVGLLHDALQPALSPGDLACVRAALDAGAAVVPIPGPSLPLAAAVLSGLPADQLVFLGPLAAWTDRSLETLATERRTLVALETPGRLPGTLAALLAAWGDRPVALAGEFAGGPDSLWRGSLSGAADWVAAHPPLGPEEPAACVLVIGGAKKTPAAWDEARLHAEVAARVARGEAARQIAQEIAAESGWPRRDVYRLATRASRPAADDSL